MAIDKAVDSSQLDADLTSVANAIRTKGGTSGNLAFPAGFVSAIQAIPTGGGASNLVTGTFKGTTTGAAMDVTLNYSGTGYPIAVIVYPTGGMAGNSDYWSLVQRYATAVWSGAKRNADVAPQYTGANYDNDSLSVVTMYKSSTSNATSYTSSYAQNQTIYNDTAAESTNAGCVYIRSKTKMSVYIAGTRGFAANIEYTYHIIYSS